MSDHTHLELDLKLIVPLAVPKPSPQDQVRNVKIRWDKCDTSLFKEIVLESLLVSPLIPPPTNLDADLCVRSLTKVLHEAAKAASPLQRKKKSKKGFFIWNERVAAAVESSKDAHFRWKCAGRPRGNSGLLKQKKEARKSMRRVLRMTLYQQIQDFLTEIMSAKDSDVKLFHRLIRRQRTLPNTATQVLVCDGATLSGTSNIASGFASHFQSLATPSASDEFDEDYFTQVQSDVLVIEESCRKVSGSSEPVVVTSKEIRGIIKSLKAGKAQDIHGLAAEHLKHAADVISSPLADLMNYILSCGYIPPMMLEGIVTPVQKKDKDPTLPTNYRGITVLSIIGKVLEKVLQRRTEDTLIQNQCRLQRGFTKRASSVNAALLISEMQNEAKDRHEPLTLVTLDAAKAFDVVWQGSLLRKIFLEGVDGTIWLTLPNMYTQATSAVRWGQHISAPFPVKQGVRQGGILSTVHYKLFNNDLLHMLQDSGLGATIGCFYCGAPTCADDVAALGSKIHAQCIVCMVRGYCSTHRYCIHPKKSEEVSLNKDDKGSGCDIKFGDEAIPKAKSTVHLGVHRQSSGRPGIMGKIQLGRRTMYSMMGAGVYGGSGLNPVVSAHLWKIYVVPRLIYGLEVLSCSPSDVQSLEKLQRDMMRRIQSLPRNTANAAVNCLLGVRPIEQELDLRRLTLLCSVLYSDGTLEQDIARRQIAVKDSDSHSWFTACNQLLHKYKLPNVYLLQQQFSREASCKQEVKAQVDSFVAELWCSEAKTKTSLQYLNVGNCKVGEVHPCWKTVANSPRDVKRAITKVRLLTGTYCLQKNRVKFRNGAATDLCLLCSAESEDRVHFIAECSALSSVRQSYISVLETILLASNPVFTVSQS